MNNLILNDNWFQESLQNISQSMQQFLKPILQLQDKHIDSNHIVKWKTNYCDCASQVVIQTNNYYYKIYESTLCNSTYHQIRQELCKIYREEYGLIWDYFIYKDENTGNVIQIQQRQKLRIPTEQDMSFDELLLNFSKILNKVEKSLNLNFYFKQLKMYNEFSDVEKIKLIRQCGNKFQDYGITNNGQIILLDDADWILVLLDKNNKVLNKNQMVLSIVDINNQDMFFLSNTTIKAVTKQQPIRFYNHSCYEFSLIYAKYTNGKTISILNKEADQQLQNNINILCNNLTNNIQLK